MVRSTRNRRKKSFAQPEITLTPLIDTALTLLVIFMVTTPMINNSLKVDLPQGNAREAGSKPPEIVVRISRQPNTQTNTFENVVYINNETKALALNELGTAIQKCAAALPVKENKQKPRVWVTFDKNEQCLAETLISVVDHIKVAGGIQDVAIATKPGVARTA